MIPIQEHIPLAPLTTFKIGGEARYLARVKNIEELAEALTFAEVKSAPVFVLGGGSNVLISDLGFNGLVIKIEIAGIEEHNSTLVAGAGESWDKVVENAVDNNLWGIENLSGIPGTVGGAVVQNIGAYGQAISQTFHWAEVFNTQTKKVETLGKEACNFGYRSSIFKEKEGQYIVLRAAFELSKTPVANLSYKDLQSRLQGKSLTLSEIRNAVLEIRAEKFPDLRIEGSAGSFFKNPILPKEEADILQAKYPLMPVFTLPETNNIKVPLGWFLDYRHGVMDLREVRFGGARMFEKQFLVIAATRGASSRDVKELADYVKKSVQEKLNIIIEPEVKII